MEFTAVVEVLDALDSVRICHWVAGGWNVAILAGAQTREHRDLDLAVDAKDLDAGLVCLESLGYVRETDWLPVRIELIASGGRWVDVHPVQLDDSGHGRQAAGDGAYFEYPSSAFTVGILNGRAIGCLSASQQLAFHSGYEHRAKDIHDLAQLEGISGEQGGEV